MWSDLLYPERRVAAIPVGATVDQWQRVLASIAADRPTLCIDFDGTITLGGPHQDGVPDIGTQPGTKQALAEWVAQGYRIVVLTARNTAEVWPWLAEQGLTQFVADVTNTKPPAVAYIDDRAVSFDGDWDAVRSKVRELAGQKPEPTPAQAAAEFHRKLKAALGQISAEQQLVCPHCGANDYGLLPPDFETAKCHACDKNFHVGIVPGLNARAEPTAAQREAGNYPKQKLRVHGLQVSIENPAGSFRRSKHLKADGSPAWETRIAYPYGYIRRTEGADGEHIDCFLTPDPEGSDQVFIINQIDPATGAFDEHKVILGARSEDEARAIYCANYDGTGAARIGSVREMPIDEFKRWALDGPQRVEASRLRLRDVKTPAAA